MGTRILELAELRWNIPLTRVHGVRRRTRTGGQTAPPRTAGELDLVGALSCIKEVVAR